LSGGGEGAKDVFPVVATDTPRRSPFAASSLSEWTETLMIAARLAGVSLRIRALPLSFSRSP
jgi:hypothetical protein